MVVKRGKNENFGFKLKGGKPVIVDSVDPNSPAELSGIYPNDVILSVNDMDAEDKSQRFLVEYLQNVGINPILEVCFFLFFVIFLLKIKKMNASIF